MNKPKASSSTVPVASRSTTHIHGRVKEILIAFAIMTLPMIIFSAILLGLVFHFRVVQKPFASSQLAFENGQDDPDVIFVKINATTLNAIASWSSTIAPFVAGFAVTLVSYPVASGILSASKNSEPSHLPTPFQFSLLLRMVSNGSPSALWEWIKYSFGWRARRERQGKPLKILTSILAFGILLSTLVFVTDTWLHFTTKTVNFFQITNISIAPDLGFGLNDNCTTVNTPRPLDCTLNNPASGDVLLQTEPVKVLSNISNIMVIHTHTVGNSQFAYIQNAQSSRLPYLDYTASSYAVQSQCAPVTRDCIPDPLNDVAGVATRYNCSFAFQGSANTAAGNTLNSLTMAYFTDSTGQNNHTLLEPVGNPYYFAAVAVVNMNNPRSPALQEDPEIVSGGHGGATIIALFCNATVYDLEYSSINGTITRFVTRASNNTMANIVQGTQANTRVGTQNLIQAASVAGLGDSAQALSDAFALSYSQTALAVATGAFQPLDAIESQSREQILVARVPKAPLACLLLANILLAILGIVLTVVALVSAHGEGGEIQARLSIPAVVALQFEGIKVRAPVKMVEDMFEERHGERGSRIGFVKTQEGGWTLESWQPT